MPDLVFKDRVMETTSVSGSTVAYVTLTGAVEGYSTFASALSVNDSAYFCVEDRSNGDWELHLNKLSTTTRLDRTSSSLISSSGGSSLVNFQSGHEIVAYLVDPARLADKTAGGTYKGAVRVLTKANQNLSTDIDNGSSVDGVTVATGDRICLAGQTAPAQNGIYEVQASGNAVRAWDFAYDNQVDRGAVFYVREGSNKGLWSLFNTGAITIGTTHLLF